MGDGCERRGDIGGGGGRRGRLYTGSGMSPLKCGVVFGPRLSSWGFINRFVKCLGMIFTPL